MNQTSTIVQKVAFVLIGGFGFLASYNWPLVRGWIQRTARSMNAATPVVNDADREEKTKARQAEMLAWNRRTMGEAYDRVGKKDPRWDDSARAAFEAAAQNFSHSVEQPTKLRDIHDLTRQAIAAGCDDPLILYLNARSMTLETGNPTEQRRQYAVAAAALAQSEYPPFRKFVAMQRSAQQTLADSKKSPAEIRAAVDLFSAALNQLSSSLKDDERIRDHEKLCYELAIAAYDVFRNHDRCDRATAFARVDAAFKSDPRPGPARLKFQADHLIRVAWDARGNGRASGVKQENWRIFEQRLAQARTSLEQAWSLAPYDERIPLVMLTVDLGEGRGRDVMELWYRRGVDCGGLSAELCHAKLNWLSPTWHGHGEESVAFARECRDARKWPDGSPRFLVAAHRNVFDALADEADKKQYYKQRHVFADLQGDFENYLAQHPNNHAVRSEYAYYSYLCGQYSHANQQFVLLGDDLTPSARFSLDLMKRAKAASLKLASGG